ncbi:MAG: metal-dependent transcriptional regulator [Methanoregula sp.]|jgi:Mn-dependent DtxR family transcriptional regulator
MSMDTGFELSPKKVEYIKFINGKNGPVKTNNIAAGFGVDPSTITKTIVELADEGLLVYVPYHGVSLSVKGKITAEFLIKRHRILALALTHFGFSHEQACLEVSRFESFVSKEAIDQMCRAMGHPYKGICGDITHDDGCLRI